MGSENDLKAAEAENIPTEEERQALYDKALKELDDHREKLSAELSGSDLVLALALPDAMELYAKAVHEAVDVAKAEGNEAAANYVVVAAFEKAALEVHDSVKMIENRDQIIAALEGFDAITAALGDMFNQGLAGAQGGFPDPWPAEADEEDPE